MNQQALPFLFATYDDAQPRDQFGSRAIRAVTIPCDSAIEANQIAASMDWAEVVARGDLFDGYAAFSAAVKANAPRFYAATAEGGPSFPLGGSCVSFLMDSGLWYVGMDGGLLAA